MANIISACASGILGPSIIYLLYLALWSCFSFLYFHVIHFTHNARTFGECDLCGGSLQSISSTWHTTTTIAMFNDNTTATKNGTGDREALCQDLTTYCNRGYSCFSCINWTNTLNIDQRNELLNCPESCDLIDECMMWVSSEYVPIKSIQYHLKWLCIYSCSIQECYQRSAHPSSPSSCFLIFERKHRQRNT